MYAYVFSTNKIDFLNNIFTHIIGRNIISGKSDISAF